MNYLYKGLLCIILFLPMQSQDTATNKTELEKDDAIAFRLLGGMQGALNAYKTAEILGHPQEKTIQKNVSAGTFSQCLGQYLTTFGMMHEKKGSIMQGYKTVYALSDKHYDHKPLTPQEQPVLIDLLEKAIKINHFKSLISIEVEIKKNGLIEKQACTLEQILAAIKQIPVATNYSLVSILTNVGIASALALGAWVAYHAITNKTVATPPGSATLHTQQATVEFEQYQLTPEEAYDYELKNAAELVLHDPQKFYDLLVNMQNNDPKTSKKFLTDLFITYPQLTGFKDIIEDHKKDPHHDESKASTKWINATGKAIDAAIEPVLTAAVAKTSEFGKWYDSKTKFGQAGLHFERNIRYKKDGPDAYLDNPALQQQVDKSGKAIRDTAIDLAAGFITHPVKYFMDAPQRILDAGTETTRLILEPTEEFKEEFSHAIDNMTPQQMHDMYYKDGYTENWVNPDVYTKALANVGMEIFNLSGAAWGAGFLANKVGQMAKIIGVMPAANTVTSTSSITSPIISVSSQGPKIVSQANQKLTEKLMPNLTPKLLDTPQPYVGIVPSTQNGTANPLRETLTSKIVPQKMHRYITGKIYTPAPTANIPTPEVGLLDKTSHLFIPSTGALAGTTAISFADDLNHLKQEFVKEYVFDPVTGKKMLDETGTAIMQPVYNPDGTLKTREIKDAWGKLSAASQKTYQKLFADQDLGGTKGAIIANAGQTVDTILNCRYYT